VNSFLRVVRSGVHQALDLGDGRDRGEVFSITAVSVERAEENHWSNWLGEGVSGGGGMALFFSLSVRPGQSASCQRGHPNPIPRGCPYIGVLASTLTLRDSYSGVTQLILSRHTTHDS